MIDSVQTKEMKSVQLTTNLRYVPLSDDEGTFGLLVVHDGDQVRYTLEIENSRQLEAAIKSFQDRPVGEDL